MEVSNDGRMVSSVMTATSGKPTLRTFDMFCGGGGSSRGALMAGATLVAALDVWELATKTYAMNFPGANVYRMKASSLSPHRLADEVENIDLLLASPECTSHSVAKGNKPICDESRDTAFEVIRFAKVLKPRWIVVENVTQMRRWRRFEEWHRKLKKIGYKTDLDVLDAQFHSTPQSRRRLFLVADLEKEPTLPKPGKLTSRTVETAILSRGESGRAPWPFSPVSEKRKATIERANRAIEELGEATSFVMVYYGTDGAGGFQTLDRPLRTVTTLDRFAYVRPNCRGHEMRMLQPSELAAAMGFPAHHKWPNVSRRERIKLIGNAVCPRVMRDVVKALTTNNA
jgi:DNA (cytosine-5)-methyltransferase 1